MPCNRLPVLTDDGRGLDADKRRGTQIFLWISVYPRESASHFLPRIFLTTATLAKYAVSSLESSVYPRSSVFIRG
jgi:hypothetical protein